MIDDKLLQAACARLLHAIEAQEFLACRDGYRPERGPGDAVRDLTVDLQYGRYGDVVEADIQGFFDHMDQDWLREMRRVRIDDRAFLGLIRKWLKAGILETDGRVIHPDTGVPTAEVQCRSRSHHIEEESHDLAARVFVGPGTQDRRARAAGRIARL